MEITCPSCERKTQSKKDVRGRKVKCSCGTSFTVPGKPKSSGTSAGEKITFQCKCGRSMTVASSYAGRKAKCKCGIPLTIPSVSTAAKSSGGKSKSQDPKTAKVQPAAAEPAAFQAISEDEWSSITSQALPPEPDPFEEEVPEKKSAAQEIMERAMEDSGQVEIVQKDTTSNQLTSARGLMFFLGGLQLALAGWEFWNLQSSLKEIEALASGIDLSSITIVLQVLIGVQAGIGILFCIFGAFIFAFPMTSTISALVLFVILEIVRLIAIPMEIANPIGWIARVVIVVSLGRAVNNAAYYNFLKRKEGK